MPMISLITWTGRATTSFRQAVLQPRRGSRAYPVRALSALVAVQQAYRSGFALSRVPLALRCMIPDSARE